MSQSNYHLKSPSIAINTKAGVARKPVPIRPMYNVDFNIKRPSQMSPEEKIYFLQRCI